MDEVERRKSVIQKRISRKINTGPYETVEISCECHEEISWKDITERQEKTDKITKVLILDFQVTLAKVLEELNLNKQGAVGKNYSGE